MLVGLLLLFPSPRLSHLLIVWLVDKQAMRVFGAPVK